MRELQSVAVVQFLEKLMLLSDLFGISSTTSMSSVRRKIA